MKCFALGLALKKRRNGNRKSPIEIFMSRARFVGIGKLLFSEQKMSRILKLMTYRHLNSQHSDAQFRILSR